MTKNTTTTPVGQVCIYPDCNCPFDAPSDPAWCARGLPHAIPVGCEHLKVTGHRALSRESVANLVRRQPSSSTESTRRNK